MLIVYLNFGRSGGTILSKCLANLPGVIFLSEVNPIGIADGGSPINSCKTLNEQVKKWYDIQLNQTDFRRSILELNDICKSSNKHLIIRDWSYVNFRSRPINKFKPVRKFLTLEELKGIDLKVFATVRNSIDMWISFGMPDVSDFFKEYLDFVNELEQNNIPIFKYEDFTRSPKKFLKDLSAFLSIDYKDVIDEALDYKKITGDIQLGEKSRGNKQNQIKPLPRKRIPPDKIFEIENCPLMIEANLKLGYSTKYNNSMLDAKNIINNIFNAFKKS